MKKKRFHRVRHHAGNAMRGGKATGISAVTGAGSAFAIGKLSEHVAFIRDNWYAPPIALLIAGHYVKRKRPNIGASIIGAAGAIGYYSYALSHAGGALTSAKGMDAGAYEASGQDAGAFGGAPDVNALTSGNNAFIGNAQGFGQVNPEDNYMEAMGLQGG